MFCHDCYQYVLNPDLIRVVKLYIANLIFSLRFYCMLIKQNSKITFGRMTHCLRTKIFVEFAMMNSGLVFEQVVYLALIED